MKQELLKPIEIERLEKYARKLAKDDFDKFDFNAEVDKSISYFENRRIIGEKIKQLIKVEPSKDDRIKAKAKTEEEMINFYNQIEIEKIEKQAELEFNKVLEKIAEDKTTNLIEEVYYVPKQYVKMVANGFARGLLLYGENGLGKTHLVMRAFKETNKKFVLLSGHISPLSLFEFLFEHRTENICLDDLNILENKINLEMLKSCLSDIQRIVQYHTTSKKKLRYPDKFLFEGTLVILLNKIPRGNEDLEAVRGRILNFELKMDYKTKIAILYDLANIPYKELEFEKRVEIVRWIRENTSEATENLNLRLLFACYEFFRFDKEKWVKLAKKLIRTDEEKELIVKGMSEKEWVEVVGKHRATYYRLKKDLQSR